MDMQNINMDGAAGFFGGHSTQTKANSVTTFGVVADATAPAGGFSALLEGKAITPEALNSEAAFSVTELLSEDETDLLHKIESLEDIDALLKRVSQLLGLNIDMEKSLYRIDPEEVPEEMISQLADFLAGLKEFAQLLTTSGEQNIPVEINGEELLGEEVFQLAEKINQETLNLELQFNKLGISDKIAVALANIQNREVNGSGIPVASNPQQLAEQQKGMPIPEKLAALLEKEEGELESIISSIRMLATSAKKENSSEKLNELSKQGESVKELLTTAKKLGEETAQQQTGSEEESKEEKLPGESQQAQAVTGSAASAETAIIETPEVAAVTATVAPETSVEAKAVAVETAEGGDDALSKILKKSLSAATETTKESNTESKETTGSTSDVESLSVGTVESLSAQIELSTEEMAEIAALDIDAEPVATMDTFKAPAVERAHTPRTFEQLVLDQVSGKLADAVKEGSREVTIVLKPEFLGEVKVTIQVEGDLVAAKLQVESQQVKQIIESNFQNLRDALQERNLHAGSLDVNVGTGDDNRRAEEQSDSKRRRRRNGIPAGIEGFEEDPFVEDFLGKETGRRFGTNSVEYYA